MSQCGIGGDSTLSLVEAQQIDATCDAFEKAIRDGEFQRVEAYLLRLPEALRPAALKELLLIEVAYRRRGGQSVDANEFRTRFPDISDSVDQRLSEESRPAPKRLLSPGTRFGKYQVERLLGAGGMGEVYRAIDTSLARRVALKVLLPRYQANPEALARIDVEAKALAALKHPHLLTVYEFGSANSTAYMALELLEGETLAERVSRGAIPAAEVLRLARQLADALAAAHRSRIVHRDLKPRNIFLVSDGTPRILDFGLASLLESQGAGRIPQSDLTDDASDFHTLAGSRLGTVGYMSPEQVRGERADERGDVFSFGCVLFEMLYGVAAFRRPSADETDAATLMDSIVRPSGARSPLEAELFRITERCVRKDADQRYASAVDISSDLDRLDQTWAARPARIARLINRTVLAATCLLAVVLGRWLWRELERTQQIKETESRFHDLVADVRKLSSGGDLERLKRSVRELNRVGGDLKWPLETIEPLIRGSMGSEKQYCYVMGYLSLEQGKESDLRRAVALFQQASGQDREFAPAQIGLAECYYRLSNAYAPPSEMMPLVAEAAKRAQNLDPAAATPYVLLALYEHRYEWNWTAAETLFQKAIDRDDRLTMAHQMYGNSLVLQRRFDEGLRELQLAMELDPQSRQVQVDLALARLFAGQTDEAERQLQEILSVEPEYFPARWALAEVCLRRGDWARSIEELRSALTLDASPEAQAELVYSLAKLPGRESEAVDVAKDLEHPPIRRHVPAIAIAIANLNLGRTDAANLALEKGLNERDEWLLWVGVDPVLEEIRNNAIVEPMRRQLGL